MNPCLPFVRLFIHPLPKIPNMLLDFQTMFHVPSISPFHTYMTLFQRHVPRGYYMLRATKLSMFVTP